MFLNMLEKKTIFGRKHTQCKQIEIIILTINLQSYHRILEIVGNLRPVPISY